MKMIYTIALMLTLPFAAHAEKSLSSILLPTGSPGCTLTETANINVNFNSVEKELATASAYIEKKTAEIQALAKEVGATTVDIQSVNYNINPYNNGMPTPDQTWQINGSLSLKIAPSDKAKDVLVALTKNKYQPSLSVSAYRSGNCQ